MEGFFIEKDGAINANVRPGSSDVLGFAPDLFPFDAWEFDDPNKVGEDRPEVKVKFPWTLVADTIKSSGDAWNVTGNVAKVPEGAYFTALRYPNLSSAILLGRAYSGRSQEVLVAPDSISLSEGWESYTVAGSVSYDLTGIPEYVTTGKYTILVYTDHWEYITSGSINESDTLSVAGDILTVSSDNFLPLSVPFFLYGYTEYFRDLMVIPSEYAQVQIDALIDNINTFSFESGVLSRDRGYTLSPDGFYWYNGGQYIALGNEAIFSGVDLKSGDWDGTIEDGLITTTGTKGWAISSKGDAEFNDGTFRGNVLTDNLYVNGEINMPGLYFESIDISNYSLQIDMNTQSAEDIYNDIDSFWSRYSGYGIVQNSYNSFLNQWYKTIGIPTLIESADPAEEFIQTPSGSYRTLNYIVQQISGSVTGYYFGRDNSPEVKKVTYDSGSSAYTKYPAVSGTNKFLVNNIYTSVNSTRDIVVGRHIFGSGHITMRGGFCVNPMSLFVTPSTKSELCINLFNLMQENSGTVMGWVTNTSGINYPALIAMWSSGLRVDISWNGSTKTYLYSDTSATDITNVYI